jgi:hypothetical protein
MSHIRIRTARHVLFVALAQLCLAACVATTPVSVSTLVASDGRSGDRLGFIVACDGDIAAVGEPDRDAIYVFWRSGDSWSQQTKLAVTDVQAGPEFGTSLDVDGKTLIAGAYGRDARRGAAYVYTSSDGVWSMQSVLTASDGVAGDLFGNAIAIEGDTALVAAKYADGLRGRVYVFTRGGTAWTQAQEFAPDDVAPDLRFGYAIALQGDTAVITAPKPGGYRGAAYVFVRANGVWAQQARLLAADGRAGDWFGSAAAVDAGTVAIGAPGRDGTGAVYVFTRTDGVWTQRTLLTSSSAARGERMGAAVALSGSRLAASSPGDNDRVGRVTVFRGAGDSWVQETALDAGAIAGRKWFGYAVAMDGSTLAVGAPPTLENRGAAVVYGGLPPVTDPPLSSSQDPPPGGSDGSRP